MAALERRGPRLGTGVFCLNEQGGAVYRSLHDRSQNQPLVWPRPYAPQDRALARQRQRRAARRYGGIAATHGGRRLADDSGGSRARVRHRRAVGGVKA
jgi:hypothetical protein